MAVRDDIGTLKVLCFHMRHRELEEGPLRNFNVGQFPQDRVLRNGTLAKAALKGKATDCYTTLV